MLHRLKQYQWETLVGIVGRKYEDVGIIEEILLVISKLLAIVSYDINDYPPPTQSERKPAKRDSKADRVNRLSNFL